MEQKKIDRINELAHKAKDGGLTADEEKERARLREEYVASFRQSLVSQLENTYVIDEKGFKKKVSKKGKDLN